MGTIRDYLDLRDSEYKTRTTPERILTSAAKRVQNGAVLSSSTNTSCTGFGQETTGLKHRFWKERIRRGVRNVGGPFFSRKVTLTSHNGSVALKSGTGATYYSFVGDLWPNIECHRIGRAIKDGKLHTDIRWTTDNAPSRGDLRAEGLRLMLSAVPTSPAFNASVALGELFVDGLFAIPGGTLVGSDPNSAAEYLNIQFGVLPVASDIEKYLEAHEHALRLAAQFMVDSNKMIRRRRSNPIVTNSSVNVITGASGAPIDMNGAGVVAFLQRNGKLTTTTTSQSRSWFSGAFQYYVPPNAEQWYKDMRARQAVYGLLPTPLTIWELTPFSWLTDWFLNTQDVLRNVFLAGTDGSILVRGYVMCTTDIKTEYTWTGEMCFAGNWRPVVLSWTLRETIKQRERTGFYGVDWKGTDLTAKQLSILAALGLLKK